MQQTKKIRRLITRDGKLDTVCRTTLDKHKGNIAITLNLTYDELKVLERRASRGYLNELAKIETFFNKLEKLQRS